MSDPPRWLDDTRAPDGAAALLRAARPSKALDAAVQARSAAKLAELATASAAATTASITGALLTTMWPKVLVGLAAVALIGASALGLRASRVAAPPRAAAPTPRVEAPHTPHVSPIATAPPRVEAAAPIAAPTRPAAPRVARVMRETARPSPPIETPIERPPETPPEAPSRAVAPRALAPSPAASASSAGLLGVAGEEPPATLLEETEALARVSSALEPDPAAARRLLDAYRARFTRSRLAPERDYLAFEIARREGAVDEARALGARFLREHPRSPHASAVRARLTP